MAEPWILPGIQCLVLRLRLEIPSLRFVFCTGKVNASAFGFACECDASALEFTWKSSGSTFEVAWKLNASALNFMLPVFGNRDISR